MSGALTITLDTTPPQLDIILPSYATKSSPLEIRVEADEELASFQNFYLIDSFGNRFDYTFSNKGTYYDGIIDLESVSYGICTFYAQVMDVVDNLSDLYSKTFNLVKGAKVGIRSFIRTNSPVTSIKTRKVKVTVI